MKIVIIGLWHQGIVGAACLADMGFGVVGADPDAAVIDGLNQGRAPIFEPGLDALLSKGLEAGRLRFVTDLAQAAAEAEFVFLMSDTPVNERDESDLGPIFAAVATVAPVLCAGTVVLVTAQVPVGTCDQLLAMIRQSSPNPDVHIAYMPENLRLGQAIERFVKPPLPVIGTDEPAAFERLMTVFGPMSSDWRRASLRTGEMVKHALNCFLGISICFANELGNVCDAVGADGQEVGKILRMEPRVGSKAMLMPGLGFSGGTLARDMQTIRHLGSEVSIPTPLLDGAWETNGLQNRVVLRKLERVLGGVAGRRVTVFGLTYKPDTSTLRRSAALDVIAELTAAGADVRAHDPKADRAEVEAIGGFTFCSDPLDAADGAAALVLMTPWSSYRDLDFAALRRRMAGSYVFDTAGLWDEPRLAALGFVWDSIGRGRQVIDRPVA